MGAGEESSPAKHSKPASTQETPPPSYADWSSSMQAYYGAGGTPPFYASTVASQTPHPYMWGGQHPMMSPYGTPVPYPALYPPAGVYAHPSMPMTPGTAPPNAEMETKAYEGKEKATNKKSKGNSGNGNVRTGESGKTASSSGNDGATQSADSGSDGSSDASDENEQHEFSVGKKGSFNQMLADASAQNSNCGPNNQTSVPGNPVVSMTGTNLNMGIDLWNPSVGSGTMKMRPNPSGVSRTAVPPPMMPDQWVQQDERELKRQKRKQSNRESARRSRLRKQAECEELQARVEALSNDNHSLREELQRLSEECEKLTSENNSIKEELTKFCGPEAVLKLDAHLESQADEALVPVILVLIQTLHMRNECSKGNRTAPIWSNYTQLKCTKVLRSMYAVWDAISSNSTFNWHCNSTQEAEGMGIPRAGRFDLVGRPLLSNLHRNTFTFLGIREFQRNSGLTEAPAISLF